MKRILNILGGAVFLPFGAFVLFAGAMRFHHAAEVMADGKLSDSQAGQAMIEIFIALFFVAVGYWGITSGWKRLRLGVSRTVSPLAESGSAGATPPAVGTKSSVLRETDRSVHR